MIFFSISNAYFYFPGVSVLHFVFVNTNEYIACLTFFTSYCYLVKSKPFPQIPSNGGEIEFGFQRQLKIEALNIIFPLRAFSK